MNRLIFSILTYLALLPMCVVSAGHKKDHKKEGCSKSSSCWDYIIVGNGTAGAVLARQLSENDVDNPGKGVLVLEAGFNYDHDPIALDPDAVGGTPNSTTLSNPPYAFKFTYTVNGVLSPTPTSAGMGWGGSSMHNFMIAVRPTPNVLNNWAALSGDSRWSYNKILPVVKAVESYYPHATSDSFVLYSGANYHERGDRGLLSILQFTAPIATDPFYITIGTHANTGVGLPADYNDPSQGTVGISAPQRFNTPFPERNRSFSSRDYLDAVVDLNGDGLFGRKLKIRSGTFVTRVLFKGKKAIGVEYFLETNPARLMRAFGKKIILAAGFFNTTPILERSGIGNRSILESLGIRVIVNNPNVGEHVQDHYGATATMTGPAVPSATGFTDLRGQDGYPADSIRRMQMNISTNAGNVQFSGLIMNPLSTGSLHIVSADPIVPPELSLHAYTDGSVNTFGTDANMIVSYLKYIKQYADQTGRTMVTPTPAQYAAGDTALLAFAQTRFGFQAHQVGSTRMATSIKDGVVDGKLRVFGVKNLMIVDNSIMPQISDGNTGFPAFLIGMEAAEILGADVLKTEINPNIF